MVPAGVLDDLGPAEELGWAVFAGLVEVTGVSDRY